MSYSRAGRFGTKGLAITFQSSSSDQEVMAAIQSRFEVAIPELPDHIDPATYSTSLFASSLLQQSLIRFCSGVLGLVLFSLRVIAAVLVPPKVSDFGLFANFDADLNGVLTVNASATVSIFRTMD